VGQTLSLAKRKYVRARNTFSEPEIILCTALPWPLWATVDILVQTTVRYNAEISQKMGNNIIQWVSVHVKRWPGNLTNSNLKLLLVKLPGHRLTCTDAQCMMLIPIFWEIEEGWIWRSDSASFPQKENLATRSDRFT